MIKIKKLGRFITNLEECVKYLYAFYMSYDKFKNASSELYLQ